MILKDLFIGFYRPSDEELKDLWQNCHFVFDANMLLNVYRYSKLARKTLIDIFEELNDRIWIPHQVALEYHFNVLGEIKNQEKTYDELQSIIKKKTQEIEEEYKKFSLRHSNLKMDEKLLKSFQDSIEKLCKDLNKQKDEHPDLNVTKNKIMELFNGKVGDPYEQEKIDELQNNGELRYELKQPPGFKDKNKGSEIRFHDGKTYQKKYGDLIFWNQLMDYSKREGVAIILVTDDRKEDWWNIISGERVGPSPQLLQEFKEKTGGNKFYMYQPKQFLNFINNFLDIKINKDTIKAAIKNIDDYKKQVEEIPKSLPLFRAKARPRVRVGYDKINLNKSVDSNGVTIIRQEDINPVHEYLLEVKLPNLKLSGEELLNKTKRALEELLPSNIVRVDFYGIGDSMATIKVTITGPAIKNPRQVEIFVGARLQILGCEVISFAGITNIITY